MANLKNIIVSDTGAVTLPSGTTAQRPTSPVDGDTRYNTDVGSIEYYYKGFWVDARTGAGGITHDGLVVYLNAGVSACYPGSGTTLYNLGSGGSSYNGTLTGSPTYSSAYGGHFYGYGGSQYISVPIDYRTQNFTVIVASRYNGASRGRILSATGNNWLLGHHSDYDACFYSEGWVNNTTSGATPSDNSILHGAWGVHTGTGNISADVYGYFRNGVMVARNTGGSQGPYNFVIGYYGLGGIGSQPSDWSWSVLLTYNRVLSDEEILKTTMAIKLRNGI